MDPGLIRDECAAYADAGVQHVVSAPWRTDADALDLLDGAARRALGPERGQRRRRMSVGISAGSARSLDHGAGGATTSVARRHEHGVVVDPPAGEVAPALVEVVDQRHADRDELGATASNSSRVTVIGPSGRGSAS